MENTCIYRTKLDNGLKFEIFDASRKIAGDRYRVVMSARVVIPVDEALSSPVCSQIDAPAARKALGPELIFEKKSERNFVDAEEKEAVFDQLRQACIDTAAKYYAHQDFAAKYLLKTLQSNSNSRTV